MWKTKNQIQISWTFIMWYILLYEVAREHQAAKLVKASSLFIRISKTNSKSFLWPKVKQKIVPSSNLSVPYWVRIPLCIRVMDRPQGLATSVSIARGVTLAHNLWTTPLCLIDTSADSFLLPFKTSFAVAEALQDQIPCSQGLEVLPSQNSSNLWSFRSLIGTYQCREY